MPWQLTCEACGGNGRPVKETFVCLSCNDDQHESLYDAENCCNEDFDGYNYEEPDHMPETIYLGVEATGSELVTGW